MRGTLLRTRVIARAVLGAVLAVAASALAVAPPPEFTYVEMPDHVKIAISIAYPDGFSADDVDEWPALFQMDGYGGGGDVLNPASWGDGYVMVYASIRGTGCSGGRFDLFDRVHAEDGWRVIESFIVAQPWSNGDVGIIGHSYPGLTGWMVASTNPPSVKAIAISGLIDDLYRGIVYPGGVPNYGFPAVWTLGARPALELAGNYDRYVNETTSADPTCLESIAARPPRDVADDPVVQGATSREDETWWQMRSTITWIGGIQKPIHITQQYQDEQTGPRGGHVLFQRIPDSIPKRLVVTNGVHSTTGIAHADRRAWLDCHVRGVCTGDIDDPTKRVRLHFETKDGPVVNPPPTSRATGRCRRPSGRAITCAPTAPSPGRRPEARRHGATSRPRRAGS
ncbi:MAG: CocE/NonD family hydrolase [Candidatus Binatia bacterium]